MDLDKMNNPAPERPQYSPNLNPPYSISTLGASTSLLVFLLYLAGQFLGGLVHTAYDIVTAVFQNGEIQNTLSPQLSNSVISPLSALAITLGSAFGLAVGAYFVRTTLRNNTPFGAAFRVGNSRGLFTSFRLGAGISILYLLFSIFVFPPPKGTQMSPLIEMGMQAGFGQYVWIALALFLAPLIEELLFRGILLGGLNRSFGMGWATVLSTTLFASLHIPEGFYYWPSLIPIVLMSLAATAQRIRWQATGAAVAVHFAYNLVVVVSVLLVAP